ncbi:MULTISPECIES: hypothetical protein [unclassified Prochlorococcus]|uniref:hypothetical protein n=1 Tax=unclassified Prochlorococcus TaxID=2627481 RepID=UPI000533AA87|nr:MULTISPECIES: hypothetical protein [unclassified Prochlorococcus]KGG16912.1 hypothetical protein EV06_0759 [Prochlorococcus sp. MIT 0602]KGG18113.1 hypothetical protein EV07_0025 [Prochlorococcus sp. MIT 0603]
MTVANQSELSVDRRLQHDSIKLAGKTIFLNPFLYWRRFDTNTDRWLREPGQIGEDQITLNRTRFYPEIDWNFLDEDQRLIKDASVEMFLKSLELISTFHPDLTSGQLLEIERKMAVTKKRAFEKWVTNSFKRRSNLELKERKRFARERFYREWKEWLSIDTTQKALFPFVVVCCLSVFGGWSLGFSSNSCTPYFSSPNNSGIK